MAEPQERQSRQNHGSTYSVLQRVALTAAILVFAWVARDLLLLLFVGVLLAVFLRTLAVWIAERTRLSSGWALLVVVLLLAGVAVGAGWLIAPRLTDEIRQLTDTLPQAANRLMERVREHPFGGWVLEQLENNTKADPQQKMVEQATTAASKTIDVVVGVVVVLFTGLYLASAPRPYVRGILRLAPKRRRQRLGEVFFAAGYTLRWWILGQLMAMTAVGLLMWIGLAIIGVPLALSLGLLAGALEFIPTIGPLLGVLPALLLALADDPQKALYVLVLYSIVQTLESYLLTPLVQEKVLELPPVVTISAQVLFTWTLGPVGLLIAVPFVAVVIVATQMLYVEDLLGDRMRLVAEKEARKEVSESDYMKGLE